MFRSVKIGTRLGAALFLITLATALIIGLINQKVERDIVSAAEQRELRANFKQLENALHMEAARALAMADFAASIPAAQKAMAENDRDTLAGIFVPGFDHMKQMHGVRQFQFHLPPATSFLRVHKPEKFGDDLSSFRKTVVETNANQAPVSGLEVGVAGLGMRGVTPVSHEGKHIGSVEFGLSFGPAFFENFKESTGADAALLIVRDGVFSPFASTFPEGFIDPANPILASALNGEQVMRARWIDDTNLALMAKPVADFSGQALGVVVMGIDRSFFSTALSNATVLSVGVAVVTLLVALLIAFGVNRSIAGPIRTMTQVMKQIAAGELGTDIPARDRKDEIGEMAQAVLVFQKNAARMKEMEDEQEVLRVKAEDEKKALGMRMADEFEQSVGSIIGGLEKAVGDMVEASRVMSDAAEQTTEQASIGHRSAESAAQNVATVAASSVELSTSTEEISRQVDHSSSIAVAVSSKAASTQVTVEGLVEAATKIGDVVSLINDIAGQTNLLALNATIEAARAGEAGKGFAVVAGEVKNLATQTGRATQEISDLIDSIQTATRDSAEAINAIVSIVGELNESASAISAAVENQGIATQEIADSVDGASSSTASVTESIGQVSQTAVRSADTALNVSKSADAMMAYSKDLRQETDNFLRKIRSR